MRLFFLVCKEIEWKNRDGKIAFDVLRDRAKRSMSEKRKLVANVGWGSKALYILLIVFIRHSFLMINIC